MSIRVQYLLLSLLPLFARTTLAQKFDVDDLEEPYGMPDTGEGIAHAEPVVSQNIDLPQFKVYNHVNIISKILTVVAYDNQGKAS